ncbi:unnamed protein product [Closterium sp. NIES-65]|nr:unnamed protein product [Closterium sp. NIES-65]
MSDGAPSGAYLTDGGERTHVNGSANQTIDVHEGVPIPGDFSAGSAFTPATQARRRFIEDKGAGDNVAAERAEMLARVLAPSGDCLPRIKLGAAGGAGEASAGWLGAEVASRANTTQPIRRAQRRTLTPNGGESSFPLSVASATTFVAACVVAAGAAFARHKSLPAPPAASVSAMVAEASLPVKDQVLGHYAVEEAPHSDLRPVLGDGSCAQQQRARSCQCRTRPGGMASSSRPSPGERSHSSSPLMSLPLVLSTHVPPTRPLHSCPSHSSSPLMSLPLVLSTHVPPTRPLHSCPSHSSSPLMSLPLVLSTHVPPTRPLHSCPSHSSSPLMSLPLVLSTHVPPTRPLHSCPSHSSSPLMSLPLVISFHAPRWVGPSISVPLNPLARCQCARQPSPSFPFLPTPMSHLKRPPSTFNFFLPLPLSRPASQRPVRDQQSVFYGVKAARNQNIRQRAKVPRGDVG